MEVEIRKYPEPEKPLEMVRPMRQQGRGLGSTPARKQEEERKPA